METNIREVLVRVFVEGDRLDGTVSFYEDLFNCSCKLRFNYPEAGLRLAQVASVLIIAGDRKNLDRFRPTTATFHVKSLEQAMEQLKKNGTVILEPPKRVPTGINMRVRHPDGLIVEYVEHREHCLSRIRSETEHAGGKKGDCL